MARFQVPAIVTHANIRPLLARLLEEPWFKIGARPKGPWPKDAWFYRPAILELPLGELAKGGLNNLALVGMGGHYTTAALTGKEGFNAQGLEGKVLIRKPLFNALMNMRDLIPVHRGRIITARLDEYAAGQKVDRNPGRRGGKARRNPQSWEPKTAVPGLALWSMYAGGTAAAEGKHGYSLTTVIGNYKIDPISSRTGRHVGYKLRFENVKGLVGSGLHQDLGCFERPSTAAAAARKHFLAVRAGKNPCGSRRNPGRDIPPEQQMTNFLNDITADVKALPSKGWLKTAAASHLRQWAGRRGYTISQVVAEDIVSRWIKKKAGTSWNPGVHKSPPFRIQYLPVNQRWVMTWGEQIIPIRDVRSFPSKAAAIKAAEAAGIRVDPKTGICTNPGPAYHKREQARYSRLLAGDLKAKHKDAAEYWQGALSAEAAAVAAGKVTRNPARRTLIAKAVLKFYQAQPAHIKKIMGRMSPEQLVLFVRKHSK